jgi:hypothetical protein
MLDPVIIADTYGASEGREVHFILAPNKASLCNSFFYMIFLNSTPPPWVLLSLKVNIAPNCKSLIRILLYKEKGMNKGEGWSTTH